MRLRQDARGAGRWLPQLARVGRPLAWLTPFGLGAAVAGLISVAVGTLLNWQEFLQFGLTCLLLIVVALFWVGLPVRLSAEVVARPGRLTDGGTTQLDLRLRGGALPTWQPRVLVPLGARHEWVPVRWVPRRDLVVTSTETRPLNRGAYRLGPALLERMDPIGLARRRIPLPGDSDQLLVRPRIVPVDLRGGGFRTDLEGMATDAVSVSDLAFQSLREYQVGDDVRHVHWRSSARAGQLLVRQYHDSQRGQVMILLDHEAGSYGDAAAFELAVSIATSIAFQAVVGGLDVHLRCGPTATDRASGEDLLDAACRFRWEHGEYVAAAASAAAMTPGAGILVQVTGTGRPIEDIQAASACFPQSSRPWVIGADPGLANPTGQGGPAGPVFVGELAQLPLAVRLLSE